MDGQKSAIRIWEMGDLYDFLIWGVDQSFNIWGAGGIGGSMKIFQLDQFHPFFWLFVKEINVF